MIRVKRKGAIEKICKCYNCGYEIPISPTTVKEKPFQRLTGIITATYVECPVCGERILKQLDDEKTYKDSKIGVKLEMIQRKGRKLTPQEKKRLQSIEKRLYTIRRKLKLSYWDEIYQSLNQYPEYTTGIADQELIPGFKATNAVKLGERNQYENELLGKTFSANENGL